MKRSAGGAWVDVWPGSSPGPSGASSDPSAVIARAQCQEVDRGNGTHGALRQHHAPLDGGKVSMPAIADGRQETEIGRHDTEQEDWDGAIRALDGSWLQSWQWGEYRRGQGWQVERIRVDSRHGVGRAQVLFRRLGPVSIAHVPRGPLLAGDGPGVFAELVAGLDAVCRQHRAVNLIIEPDQPLPQPGVDGGFTRWPRHFHPDRTVKVPLLADDALLAQMHHKTRYKIRLAQRRGVTVVQRAADDDAAFATFYRLLQDTAQRNGFPIHPPSYYADFLRVFENDAALLFAQVGGTAVATLITVRFGNEAIYVHGGSSSEHRTDGATFFLQYEAMRWARAHRCQRYDLWGIPTGGLQQFKIGFGGDVIAYAPPLERRYRPLLAWLARGGNAARMPLRRASTLLGGANRRPRP
jgi:peptidoglycan pentaglycine glycine transferase (the first glycine)